MTFEGKVVAITGAAGGVGQSLCRYFIDQGAKIAAIDKNASVENSCSGPEGGRRNFLPRCRRRRRTDPSR